MYRQSTARSYPLCVQLYTFSHNIKKVIKSFSVDADTFLTSFIKFINSVATFKTSQKAIINLRSSKGGTRRIKHKSQNKEELMKQFLRSGKTGSVRIT